MQKKLQNDSSLNQSQSKLTTKLAGTFQSKIDLVPELESISLLWKTKVEMDISGCQFDYCVFQFYKV